VGNVDDGELVRNFIASLKQAEASPESWAQSGTEMWKQSGMVRVVRDFPMSTASGKVLPFHIARPGVRVGEIVYQEKISNGIPGTKTETVAAK
jgi:hypothetical protein